MFLEHNEHTSGDCRTVPLSTTYHTDLSGHQVTQSVEPVDVGLQVTGFTLPEETLKNKRREMTCSKHVKVHRKKRILFVFFNLYFVVLGTKVFQQDKCGRAC